MTHQATENRKPGPIAKLADDTRAILDTLSHVVSIRRDDGTVEYLSAQWFTYTGAPANLGLDRSWREFVHPGDLPVIDERMREARRPFVTSQEYELRLRARDGTFRWFLIRAVELPSQPEGLRRWLVTGTDIDDLKRAQAALATSALELEHLAHHDPMTKLPNRTLLMEQLAHAIGRAQRAGTGVVVMYLDLDNFKTINDTLGHAGGDLVLAKSGERIAELLREGDTASRVGGDEFVLVCATSEGPRHAARIAKRLLSSLMSPIAIGGALVSVGASIGISLYPNDGIDPDTLIRKADKAMYAAKAAGRCTYRIFSAKTHAATVEEIELEADLREAIAVNEFVVHYQPIVSIASGRVLGAEALVRWDHPRRGVLEPHAFIAFAEKHHLITHIGHIVLHAACAQLNRITQKDGAAFTIAVNVSAQQFLKAGFVDTVAAAMALHRIGPGRLELEITESIMMDSGPTVTGIVDELRALGVRLSIDDFGTGYSSLIYLRTFPVHTIKIDRTFVTDIATNRTDQAIATAITALAHSMGIHVIAEGVETPAQLTRLRTLGTDSFQGHLISRPLPGAEFEAFVARNDAVAFSSGRRKRPNRILDDTAPHLADITTAR